MILSYRDKRTLHFAEGTRVKALDGLAHKAELKLDQLDAATTLRDLDLPANRFQVLESDRKGQYGIGIIDQWRICFEWPEESKARRMSRLLISTEFDMARTPSHPGEHLTEQLDVLNMSATELARQIRVPTNRVTQILKGERSITGDTAL